MADITKIGKYDIKDSYARERNEENSTSITAVDGRVVTLETSTDTMRTDIDAINEYTLSKVVAERPTSLVRNREYGVIHLNDNYPERGVNNRIPSLYERYRNGYKTCYNAENLNRIRVATFNIENEGYTPNRYGLKHWDKTIRLKRVYDSFQAHVLCLQEALWGGHKVYIADTQHCTTHYKYKAGCSTYTPNADLSFGPMTLSHKDFVSGSKKIVGYTGYEEKYQVTAQYINGKEVSVYNTHIQQWLDDSSTPILQAQAKQLSEAVLADPNPYKVICGDFNIDTHNNFGQYFPLLQNAGYQRALTLDNPQGVLQTVENIFFSPNMSMVDVSVFTDSTLSDHSGICVELQLN